MAKGRRTALITGSNKNIGRACALLLAKDGCNVVINGSQDRQAAQKVANEARDLGVEALVAMGDVGKREDCMPIAEESMTKFGAVDVLVNNAAVREDGGFLDVTEEEWRRVMAINFDASYWLSRVCLPGMINKGWGLSLIHI